MNGNILIVEDDMDFAGSLKTKIEELSIHVVIKGFSEAMSEIAEIAPDVVVLDVFQGRTQFGEQSGLEISDLIWRRIFVPIIFASAGRYDLAENIEKHPLVRRVNKTATVFDEIITYIGDLLPFGKGIKEIKKALCSDAEQTTQEALTGTTPHALKGRTLTPGECLPLIQSAARRRLSVLMRQKSEQERSCLFAWEQYIFPAPEAHHFLTGDILASSSGDRGKPEAFRIVLTPSCDLANPKVDHVLVAKCVSIEEFCLKNGIPKGKKGEDKLSSLLTQAQSSGYKVLPAYSDLIPSMALSLRDLELLSIKNTVKAISADEEEFERLASMDSPFREQLAWAYLQIAGRPGVPRQDLDAWGKEILNCLH